MARSRSGGAVQSKIQMILFGAPFTGKSTLALQSAYLKRPDGKPFRVLYIDPESGSIDDYLPALQTNGIDLQNIYIVYTQSLSEVRELIERAKSGTPYYYYNEEGEETEEVVLDADGQPFNPDINIEEIPAERAAAVLMQKDMLFYPNQAYELPLYGNQWIPLGIKTTLHEKIRLSAILDKACSGGSIAHINIEAPFSNFDQAWSLLNYIADQGVVYFAFCTRISACKYNHGFYGETCPICGLPKETTYQRIVGFLTPEKTYSKERKAEFAKRDWLSLNAMEDL